MGSKKKDSYLKLRRPSSDDTKVEKVQPKKSLPGAAPTTDLEGAAPPLKKKPTGVDRARKRRLKRAGFTVYECPITGILLDVGARAAPYSLPVEVNGQVMSLLAKSIIESNITAERLEKTAKKLRIK